jgi:hypothetical protein
LPLSATRALFGQGHTAGVREFGLPVDLFSPTVVPEIGRSSFPDDSKVFTLFQHNPFENAKTFWSSDVDPAVHRRKPL